MAQQRLGSPAEWEVLEYVTEHHPISVREVTQHFAGTRGYARTTVLTLMERLREKGYLSRRKDEGVNRYFPSEPRGELLRSLVAEFVQKALRGSVSPFTAYLARDAHLSREELAELKQLVSELEVRSGEDEP